MTTAAPTTTAAVAEELVSFCRAGNFMEEMELYEVKDGKIVREHFFYRTS
jgi:hypothetical protein